MANSVFIKLRRVVKHSTLIAILLLWLIGADVFQMPRLYKHLNVASNCKTTMKRLTFLLLGLIIVPFLTSFQGRVANKPNGEELAKNCLSCHSGKSKFSSLKHIRKMQQLDWIVQFTQNPAKFITKDRTAAAVYENSNGVIMTGFSLSKPEIVAILNFIDTLPE